MKKLGLFVSAMVFLGACGGGGGGSSDESQNQMPDQASVELPTAELPENGPDLGAATPVVVDTAEVVVSEEFTFSTARTIVIDFDIADAQGTDASVSICTEYDPEGGAFDVDYSSCNATANLIDGKLNHEVEVTNDYDSVAGVVWFQDEREPLFKEFHLDNEARISSDGTVTGSIVWR